ncbi:ABC transporter substrate-binding protein [Paenarthrobacter sp. NPDC090522]|uniref:ABC transporter substrate-binding protein n=1 Tax=Paenarthrobacter sp. NPDC090522 TaxID=3364383 RepID=UPI003824EAAB
MDSLECRVLGDGSVITFGSGTLDPLLRDLALGFLAEKLERVQFIWTRPRVPMRVRIERAQRLGHAVAHVQGTDCPSLPWGTTVRELDVVTLLVAGLTNAQVAAALHLSVRTVTTHIDRLMRKFNAPNRATVATMALEQGLVVLPFPAAVEDVEHLALGRMLRSAGQRSNAERSTATTLALGEPMRIGALIPSLGRGRADALEMLHGATQAVEEINARGGIRGRLLAMDVANVDADDEASTRAGLAGLLNGNPVAVTSGYLAGQSSAMNTAAATGIPFLHSSASATLGHLVSADGRRFRNTFQFSPDDEDYAPTFVSFLTGMRDTGQWQPVNGRLAVVVQSRWDIVDLGLDIAARDATARGWELEVVHASDQKQLGPAWVEAARTVRSAGVAAFMIGSYFPDDHFQLIREYLKEPGEALIYSAYAPSVSSFRSRIGPIVEGLLWATTTGTYSDDLGTAFARRYQVRFGELPGRSHAGIAYDRIHILANAWRQAEDVRDFDEVGALLSETRHRGVNGAYVFDAAEHRTLSLGRTSKDPSLSQAHTIFQIQSGQNIMISPDPYAEGSFVPPPWTTAGGAGR